VGFGFALWAAFVLLLVGSIVHFRHRTRSSVSRTESKGTAPERLREQPWYLRVALLLIAGWAVWLLAFNVWAWTVSELKSANVYVGYTVVSVMALGAVTIGLAAAIWRPGWGAIAGGLLVTVVAVAGSGDAVNKMNHWGGIGKFGIVHTPDRTTPWVPLDSLGSVPYWVLLPAGVVLLVGGVIRVVRATYLSIRDEGWREPTVKQLHPVKQLRAVSWTARAASLLVAVWAVWLLAFNVWAWTVPEWHKPAANDEVYFGYTVLSAVALIVVAIGLVVAIRRPGWGEIGGGLVVTLLAQWGSRDAVTELRSWGELVMSVNEDRGTPWVPLDSLDLVPYWVLLVAGVLLVVGGIAHALHPTHGSTPHTGAAM